MQITLPSKLPGPGPVVKTDAILRRRGCVTEPGWLGWDSKGPKRGFSEQDPRGIPWHRERLAPGFTQAQR